MWDPDCLMRTAFISLTTTRLRAGLPLAELEPLQPHLNRVRLVSEQVLIERGQAAEHVFFIEDGMILLKTETEASRPGVQVAMIGREGMVGGLALLGGDSLAFASAV